MYAASRSSHTKVTWSLKLWKDLPYKFTEWRDFDHFEVRDAKGKVLEKGRDGESQLTGHHEGVTVVTGARRIGARDSLLRARSRVEDGEVVLDPLTGQESWKTEILIGLAIAAVVAALMDRLTAGPHRGRD